MAFERNIAHREQCVAAFADQTARVAQETVLRHRFSRFQPGECVVRRRGVVHGTRGNVRAQRRPVERRSGRAGTGTELERARNRTIAANRTSSLLTNYKKKKNDARLLILHSERTTSFFCSVNERFG